MKWAGKIIAGGLWFGFVLWFSSSGDGFFFNRVNSIEQKTIQSEFPPEIDFALTLIPWNCFVSALVCLPFWLAKNRRANVLGEIGAVLVFFFWLLGWNLLGVLFWLVCFPESISDYSGAPSLSVIEPFAIKNGWSPFEIWCTWWGFIILSSGFSAVMTLLIWRPRQQPPARP